MKTGPTVASTLFFWKIASGKRVGTTRDLKIDLLPLASPDSFEAFPDVFRIHGLVVGIFSARPFERSEAIAEAAFRHLKLKIFEARNDFNKKNSL